MGFERCGKCTAPVYVRLAAVWNDDGTVTGRFAGHTRVVQIYSAEINHILNGISERIGLDIGRIIVEGERKAAVEFTGEVLGRMHGIAGAIARNRMFAKLVLKFVLRAVKNAGLGDPTLTGYERGRKLSVEFTMPFNIPILAGEIQGAFEAFFRQPGEVTWEGDTHFARIEVVAGAGDSHVEEERLKPVLPPTIPGRVSFNRCARCGMPLEVTGRYSFDLDAGIATEVATGRRIVTVIIDSLNAVFAELEKELGPEVPSMIVELESDYIEENASRPDGPVDQRMVERMLEDLRVKGMGNPSAIKVDKDSLQVRIDNPFSEELLAGRVLGLFRTLWGGPADVEWSRDGKGYMTVAAMRVELSPPVKGEADVRE